jgi:hypothetical protein
MTQQIAPPDSAALVAGVQEARRKRLAEVAEDVDYSLQDKLGGRCPRNAYVLAETLRTHGFDPVIFCGGAAGEPVGQNGIKRSTLPTVIEECREAGQIHYWVETACRTYTLDLAGEFPVGHPNRHQPFIAQSTPRNYYYLQDGINYTFNPPPAVCR